MIKSTPPMGWNSWNTFGANISESLIRETADAMVDTGMKDAGYEYVIIDDCWAEKERDSKGKMVESHEKFPSGMKALSSYVHKKGLKFGMYSCGGTMTCASYPGSFEHEFDDARTFANFGADYLKYDYCFHPVGVPSATMYKRMSMALRSCGRDILFAACNWGTDSPEKWMAGIGAHSFRSTGDIQDNWTSIKERAQVQATKDMIPYSRPYCSNDMDMLVVGMNGKGNVAMGGCSFEEYKTHFALWAMHGSPLIAGCDIRNMTEETKTILLNKEIIAIDQDIECRPPFLMADPAGIQCSAIYVKPLHDGSYAICFVNYSDAPINLTLLFWDMGLSDTGYGLKIRDLWAHEDLGVFRGDFTCSNIPEHASRIFNAKVVKVK